MRSKSRTARRLLVFAAGLSTVLAESVAGAPTASAGGFTDTKEACVAAGGIPNWVKEEGRYFCETLAKDETCAKRNPDLVMAQWNVETKKCEEGCFLTTACVGLLELEDDCFELRWLREFRDRVLIKLPGGSEDVEHYYRVAPKIVEAIARGTAPRRELARLYAHYILPSAFAARLGLHGQARRLYTAMMRDVAGRFGFDLARAA